MSLQPFFKRPTGLIVAEIAALTGAVPHPDVPLDRLITGIASLDAARPSDLAYCDNVKMTGALSRTRAGACLLGDRFEPPSLDRCAVLRTKDPYRAFVTVVRKLYPDALKPTSLFETEGAAAGATVHPTARIEDGVTIDPGAVIGPRAGIGSGTVIGANAVIGPDVQIGRNGAIGPGASILNALIGDNVIIHGGCRIGSDGFRYNPGAGGHVKVPQIGRVIIQDHVELGAGTTVDRGGMGDTVIGEGTKIDNLVQIGHNCMIGRHCIIVSQCGISGSVTIEDYAMLGGQVGVADHVTIGERARVAAKSGVMSNIPAGTTWMGYPAMPGSAYMRIFGTARKALK
ncbi:MAG: UDP-3-O-(3-hydroxymyristoyl)glucosamine N-acyltransferase [Alphaproteobacteria bacterium]|nr:UDP-3-O-(3-hydroxymyristoyl)glucosamine N-acyltransferase [Alphaproteobacteria bacterium]